MSSPSIAGDDFPFYDGRPVPISGAQWLVVLAAVAVGFAALVLPVAFFSTAGGQFIPAVLFFAIPLAALAWVAPNGWKALFRRIGLRDVMWMVLIALLNIAVTCAIGYLLLDQGYSANPAIAALADQSTAARTLFLLKAVPQLFGEELLTILPLLALMWFFHSRVRLSRSASIVLAWLLSGVIFALVHLPTYNWELLHCLAIIGSARLVLSLAYLKTRNIWVSTGAHVLNDWALIGVALTIAAIR